MLKPVEGKEDVFEWEGEFKTTKKFVLSDFKKAGNTNTPERKIKSMLVTDLPPAFEPINNKVVCIRDYISENNTRSSYKELVSALKYLGVKEFSLIKGTFQDQHGRATKLTKLFDPASTARKDLEKAKTAGLYILLTNDPYMRYTMTTGRSWTSCMRMNYDGSRVQAVMSKGNYFVAYLIDGAPKFDDLKACQGRFMIALGGKRADVLAGHILSHQNYPSDDKKHKIEDIMKALKAAKAIGKTKDTFYCPLCGDKIVQTKKPDPQKFNQWLEGSLYTPKQSLRSNFSKIIGQLDQKLVDAFGVTRLPTRPSAATYYLHGKDIPYHEGTLAGGLINA